METIDAAREHVERVRERWKYVDTDEGQAAIAAAEKVLTDLEQEFANEQKRLAAIQAAAARKRKAKEQAAERAIEQAREALPELSKRMETKAREAWSAAITWATQAVAGLQELEERADELDAVREEFRTAARAAGEIKEVGFASRPSPALGELLKVARSTAGDPPDALDEQTVKRLEWALTTARYMGVRDGSGLGLPVTGPSIAMEEKREGKAREAQAEALRASEERRKEAQRKRASENERLAQRILSRIPEVKERLKAHGYTGSELEQRALEIARQQVMGGTEPPRITTETIIDEGGKQR